MSESDVEVEFKSDGDDTESVGSVTGSLDDSKNESKSVYFSDDDDYDVDRFVKEFPENKQKDLKRLLKYYQYLYVSHLR